MSGRSPRADVRRRQRKASELARRWEAGYLSLDTFEERVLAAYTARTPAQLSRLTADLPPGSLAEVARRAWRWLSGGEDADEASARLRRRDGCWSIEDLASTNGTRLNGWRIEDARLRDGDRLALDGAQMVFRER